MCPQQESNQQPPCCSHQETSVHYCQKLDSQHKTALKQIMVQKSNTYKYTMDCNPKMESTATSSSESINNYSKIVQLFHFQFNKPEDLQNPRNVKKSITAARIIRANLLQHIKKGNVIIRKRKKNHQKASLQVI